MEGWLCFVFSFLLLSDGVSVSFLVYEILAVLNFATFLAPFARGKARKILACAAGLQCFTSVGLAFFLLTVGEHIYPGYYVWAVSQGGISLAILLEKPKTLLPVSQGST